MIWEKRGTTGWLASGFPPLTQTLGVEYTEYAS